MAVRTPRVAVMFIAGVLGIASSLTAVTRVHAATTITVPGMEPSIQAAITAASNGDVVLVSPGTYTENIDFLGKLITVESSQGPATTIIDGGGIDPVASFTTSEGRSSVLEGFTLRNGSTPPSAGYEGGGVHIIGASPSILNNVISGNGGCMGVGLWLQSSSALIQGNTISNNRENTCSGGFGGGISMLGAGSEQILGNTITGNVADFGGGIAMDGAGTPTLANNVITNNSSANQGGGVWAVNQTDAMIVQNIIAGNSSILGSGVYVWPTSGTHGPTLTNDTIAGDALWVGGYDMNVLVINTLLIAPAGLAAAVCDTNYNPGAPSFVTDDLYSGGGTAWTGPCLSGAGSAGDLSADPQFVNPASADYHLNTASPVVNAGTNIASGLLPTDLDGNARISGGVVDLGVYEVAQPPIVPGPVTNLQAQRTKSTINVSWAAPISTGGIPLTGYVVTRSPGTSQTVSASSLSVTLTGTSKNTAYTITVAAVNSVGAGPPSSVVVPKQ